MQTPVQMQQLNRSVIELKNSLRTIIECNKGDSSDLDELLHSMIALLDTDEYTFSLSTLMERFKKQRNYLQMEQLEQYRSAKIETAQAIGSCLKKNLSTVQVDLLGNLLSSFRSDNISNEELMEKFANTLNMMAEEIEMSREKAVKIVDDNHRHIKQNEADIIAADIQTASRRLTREISTLSSKLCAAYPDDLKLKAIKENSDTARDRPDKFFFALDKLQELNRYISNLIQKERMLAQQAMVEVQAKIISIYSHVKDMDTAGDEADKDAEDVASEVERKLMMLQRQACNSESMEDMQALISESIATITGTMESYVNKQKKLNLSNKNRIGALSRDAKAATEQLKIVKRKLDTVQEDAYTDELCKIPNRKGYMREIQKSHQMWKLGKQKLSLVVVDVDHFKNINDTHGHNIGDQVLKRVASIIEENIRETDRVCRYGGEEFVVICNDTDTSSAVTLAHKLRKQIEKRNFKKRGSDTETIRITASFGVSEFTDKRAEIVPVFNAADKALYYSKEKGRNRVTYVDGKSLVEATIN